MNSVTFHKSASKDVRPFFDAAALEDALKSAQIRLFEDQAFTSDTAYTIQEHDDERLAIAIRPNLSEPALDTGGIPRSNLALLVTAVSPFLKKTVIVYLGSLGETLPAEIEVGRETLMSLGGGVNVTFRIALCLSSGLDKVPGKPFMRGHWVARKSFDLRSSPPSDDFEVEPIDDEGWKGLGYPPKTLYQVEYYGGFNEPVDKSRPIAKIRIHSDVHKKLTSESAIRTSRPLMALLAAEIPCQLIAASFNDWKDVEAPEPKSPLEAFLSRIKRIKHDASLKTLQNMAAEPGMSRLKALLHVDQQSVSEIAKG